ncbi:MAG: SPP1 phage holin family protein [Candidatus Marinimicrobia bacterium]|nr:SPP1 phage holin family protein [Candidatus Neomarinimicrobiota bacterium]MCF7850076.1 SPP1 phage holin family protein [Candidatus Neomarinimicrobiota bacterium]MCF7904836.1 SPP1 phage holin family protein [Candidatus Neomarinimicrobiota bacterium]
MKRQLPIAIAATIGFITLFGWFVDEPNIRSFVDDDATQWFDILASFAIFLGALNLLKLQAMKIMKQQKGWPYAALAIVGFTFSFTAGFFMLGSYNVEISQYDDPAKVATVLASEINLDEKSAENILLAMPEGDTYLINAPYFTKRGADKVVAAINAAGGTANMRATEWGSHISTRGSLFNWMFRFVFTPLSATMFALLAFFVASASYRAFKIRNFEATLLLISGIIIMLGRVPIGGNISAWFIMYILVLSAGAGVNSWFKNRTYTLAAVGGGLLIVTIAGFITGWPVDQPAIFYLPVLQDWIYNNPNVAGARAIMIGIGLGIFATSIRYILGIEKSYIGE